MIHRLAEIGLSVLQRLAGLAHQQSHQRGAVGLEEIGGAIEQRGTRLAAPPVPILACRLRRTERLVDGLRTGTAADAHDDAPVMRRRDPTNLAPLLHLMA